jgi:hypothetical protein
MVRDDEEKGEERWDESDSSHSSAESEQDDDAEEAYEVPPEKPISQARRGSGGLAQKPLRQSTANGAGYHPSETPPVQQNLRRPAPTNGQNAANRPQDPSRTSSQQGNPRRQPTEGEINERYRDVRSSGQWGKISRTEMMIGVVIVIVVIAGAVTGVVLATGNKPAAPNTQVTPPPTSAPSVQPEEDPADQLLALLDAMEGVNISTMFFPSDATYFTPDLIDNNTRVAGFRAMSWILNKDPRDSPPDNPWLGFRYALATIYFAFQGQNWTHRENWLTGEHACKWHGIECDVAQDAILELDLSYLNAKGQIPIQLSLLSDLRSLILSGNHLSGTIPSERLGNMRDLSLLYLNDNVFTGDLSELSSLNANNVLSKCESASHFMLLMK